MFVSCTIRVFSILFSGLTELFLIQVTTLKLILKRLIGTIVFAGQYLLVPADSLIIIIIIIIIIM